MGNRIDVTKGSAAGAGTDGILTFDATSVETSLKASLAKASSSGWKTAAIDAPADDAALRSAFSTLSDFLFGAEMPQTVIIACSDDKIFNSGKELLEETFS